MLLVFIGNHTNLANFIAIIRLSIGVIKFGVDCLFQRGLISKTFCFLTGLKEIKARIINKFRSNSKFILEFHKQESG